MGSWRLSLAAQIPVPRINLDFDYESVRFKTVVVCLFLGRPLHAYQSFTFRSLDVDFTACACSTDVSLFLRFSKVAHLGKALVIDQSSRSRLLIVITAAWP